VRQISDLRSQISDLSEDSDKRVIPSGARDLGGRVLRGKSFEAPFPRSLATLGMTRDYDLACYLLPATCQLLTCELKQRQLSDPAHGLRRHDASSLKLGATAAEEEEEVAADPFLGFAEVTELPLVRVKAPVVAAAENVVQIFVMDDRLNEEGGDLWGVEEGMNPDLVRHVVVRTEPDAPALFPCDSLAPSHTQRALIGKVRAVHLGSEGLEMVMRVLWKR